MSITQESTNPITVQATAFMHHPEPIPWNRPLAEALISQTVRAIGDKLSWPEDWMPRNLRVSSPTWPAVDAAQDAVDYAMATHDVEQVARACQQWWRALRQFAEAAQIGWFVVWDVSGTVLTEALPHSQQAVADWETFCRGVASRQSPEAPTWHVTWETPEGVTRDVWLWPGGTQ